MTIDNWLNHNNYYDNYIFKGVEAEQVPEFNMYNMTARMEIMYKHIAKYANLLFSTKHNKFFVITPMKNPRTAAKQIIKYKITLNNFVY